MNKPGIVTAIPLRRYSFGEFALTVLGEVESNDGIRYAYVMAVIRGQDPEPGIYITAEKGAGSGYDMRIIMRDGAEIIGHSEQWNDLEVFIEEAVRIVSQVLDLSDEVPYQLM
ncbi:MAG: hypothetical protein QNL87_09410 [Gammaproteobacteria bacterium]|nr:hypothetical protein [Gammaproteobacteria bacterium]